MAQTDIKKLQRKILDIAVYLDGFCRDNDIEYYLMGGSALGAVRHGGFIPWDDDLDVFMTADNYWKFIAAARTSLDTDKFFLQEENSVHWPMFYTKLRMNRTTFIESHDAPEGMHQGIFVDIFCLNNVPPSAFWRRMQYLAARLLTARTLAEKGYRSESRGKKIALSFSRIFIGPPLKEFLIGVVRRWNGRQTGEVGHFFGKAKFRNTCFPRFYLGRGRYVAFDGESLPVPAEVENYLAMRFGDYMKLPAQNERLAAVHALFADTEADYREYNRKK